MNEGEAIGHIINELGRAKDLHPDWPEDPVHQAAIVAEEAGELQKAALEYYYESGDVTDVEAMRQEAIQTGAMAIRFLAGLES